MRGEAAEEQQAVRVLHVVQSLEQGGMENGVVNMANLLHDHGAAVTICCLAKRGQFADRLKAGIEVVVLGKSPGFEWGLPGRLRGVCRRCCPDVVHTHNLGTLIYAVLAWLGMGLGMARRPAILHGEHAQLPEEEKRGKRVWQRRVFYQFTRAIHVVSHGMREDFGRAGFMVRDWEVVVNGVDVEKFRPLDKGEVGGVREELGFGPDEVVLGLVGRYGQYKGHLRVLRAFEKLAVNRPELRLLFVGEGGPKAVEVGEAIAASPVKGQVVQAGYQAEMKPYYQALDLLVVASVNEGLSNAVLEAMSCGIPILAHPACGNAEVLEDGREGYLRDLAQDEGLLNALVEALEDQTRWRELGAGGRARAVRDFGINAMAAGYLDLYERLRGARRGAAGEPREKQVLGGAEG